MSQTYRAPSRIRPSGAILFVCLLAVVLLIVDHWTHVFGMIPYLLLLACPLMHLLHGRHHGTGPGPAHRAHDRGRDPQDRAAR